MHYEMFQQYMQFGADLHRDLEIWFKIWILRGLIYTGWIMTTTIKMFVCLTRPVLVLHVAGGGGGQFGPVQTWRGARSLLRPPAKSNSKPQEYITLFQLELLCVIEKIFSWRSSTSPSQHSRVKKKKEKKKCYIEKKFSLQLWKETY